jgi:hypothetical protein
MRSVRVRAPRLGCPGLSGGMWCRVGEVAGWCHSERVERVRWQLPRTQHFEEGPDPSAFVPFSILRIKSSCHRRSYLIVLSCLSRASSSNGGLGRTEAGLGRCFSLPFASSVKKADLRVGGVEVPIPPRPPAQACHVQASLEACEVRSRRCEPRERLPARDGTLRPFRSVDLIQSGQPRDLPQSLPCRTRSFPLADRHSFLTSR